MSSAMVSAIAAMREFNAVLRSEMDKPVKLVQVSLPKGPLDPKKIKIDIEKNYNTGKFEVLAFYQNGKGRRNRRLIRLGREFGDYAEADKDARWVRRQVKCGQMIIKFPGV